MTNPKPPWEFEEPLCAEVGTNMFFPKEPDDPELSASTEADYAYARKVCAICPHQAECAEWALTKNERFGMWGGLSPRDRVNIQKGRPLGPTLRLKIRPV